MWERDLITCQRFSERYWQMHQNICIHQTVRKISRNYTTFEDISPKISFLYLSIILNWKKDYSLDYFSIVDWNNGVECQFDNNSSRLIHGRSFQVHCQLSIILHRKTIFNRTIIFIESSENELYSRYARICINYLKTPSIIHTNCTSI